jgi:hypothetical protein
MPKTWTINSESSLSEFKASVEELYKEHRFLTFAAPRIGKDRTLSANALSHVWYNQADKQLGQPIGTARAFCKLQFGVPILRGEDQEFRGTYDRVIKPIPYELKLKIMAYFPVTSLMSREQMARYLTNVQVHFAANEGVILESSGEFKKYQEKVVTGR